jgi:hypothetical protein
VFQKRDAPRDGGLGPVQDPRGAGESLLPVHRHEGFEGLGVHAAIIRFAYGFVKNYNFDAWPFNR